MPASTAEQTGPAPGWHLATIGGVPVYIGKSWPFIALFIAATYGPGVVNSRPDLGVGAYVVAVRTSGPTWPRWRRWLFSSITR